MADKHETNGLNDHMHDTFHEWVETSEYFDMDQLDKIVSTTSVSPKLKSLHINIQSLPAKFDKLRGYLQI